MFLFLPFNLKIRPDSAKSLWISDSAENLTIERVVVKLMIIVGPNKKITQNQFNMQNSNNFFEMNMVKEDNSTTLPLNEMKWNAFHWKFFYGI